MVEIDVDETSGVDWPAHLAPGWVVCKSATAQDVQALFGPDATEGNHTMATEPQGTPSVEDLAKQVEELTKSLATQTTAAETAKQEAADAKDALTKAEALAKAADEADLTEEQKMLKALPAEMRDRFEKMEADNKAQAEKLQKAIDDRLDDQARTDAATMFKSVAIDADTFGPQLRHLALINADLHKSVVTALKAADNQLETAGIFSTVGKNGGGASTAEETLKAKAAELRTANPELTAEGAFAKACSENSDLLKQYYEETGK